MFETTATLYEEHITKDASFNEVKTYTENEIFVRNVRSVGMNEFYQAAAQGLKPSVVLVIFFGDYHNEKIVGWQGGVYTVTRAYQRPDSDDLELTLELNLEHIDGIVVEEVSA